MIANAKILDLRQTRDAPRWRNGDQLLAVFDCEVAGFRLGGCQLVQSSRGFLIAQPPKGVNRNERRAIEVIDPEIRAAMCSAARAAFLAIGGILAA